MSSEPKEGVIMVIRLEQPLGFVGGYRPVLVPEPVQVFDLSNDGRQYSGSRERREKYLARALEEE